MSEPTAVVRWCAAAPAVLMLVCAGPAAADEPEPTPTTVAPAPAPPTATIGTVLGQSGKPAAGPFGLPDMSTLGIALLLGQNAAPSAPGNDPARVPALSAFNPAYLVPQNADPAAPGEGTAAPGIGPDADNPSTGRIAFLRRLHEMYAAGELRGALLGQAPKETVVPGESADVDTLILPDQAVNIPN